MSMTSLSVDQILDIWSELSSIWYERINEEDPDYGFQFYAYRIVPNIPTIQRLFEHHGSDVESWIDDTIDPERYRQDILRPWGGLSELLQRFEKKHSTSGYKCKIYINGRRVGKWMGVEMLGVWRCELEIRYRVTAAAKA